MRRKSVKAKFTPRAARSQDQLTQAAITVQRPSDMSDKSTWCKTEALVAACLVLKATFLLTASTA
jgi:hypothetical protein